jgi:cell division protein FtsQ
VEPPGSERLAAERSSTERSGSGRPAADRLSSERSTAGRSATERPSAERSGGQRFVSDRTGSDRSGSDRSGSDRTGSDRSGSDRSGSDRSASGRPAAGRPISERSGSDRSAAGRSASGRSAAGRSGSGRPVSGRSAADRPSTERSVRGRRVEHGRVRRRDPRRGKIIRRRVVALAVVIGTLGLLYGVYFTPLLGVRSVQVLGTKDLTQNQVLDAAAVTSGAPMLTINLAAIRDRVAALNRVASVNVSRSWPATVRIDVAERVAVGVIKQPDGAHLVDRTAKDFATVPSEPAGLPELELTHSAPTDPTAVAVVQVLLAVPDKIRAEVLSVSAKSPNSVTLTLSAGRQVRWGGVEDSTRKAGVLTALMTQPGKVYDVSSPQLATISNP